MLGMQAFAQPAGAVAPAAGEFSIPAAPILIPEGPWQEVDGCVCAPKGFKAQGQSSRQALDIHANVTQSGIKSPFVTQIFQQSQQDRGRTYFVIRTAMLARAFIMLNFPSHSTLQASHGVQAPSTEEAFSSLHDVAFAQKIFGTKSISLLQLAWCRNGGRLEGFRAKGRYCSHSC